MRQVQSRTTLIALLIIVAVVFTLHLSVKYRNEEEKGKEYYLKYANESSVLSTPAPEPPKKLERTNLFFLKMHKCGSSTIQNILMRFGYSRNLDFVLPSSYNYIGNPIPFEAGMISDYLRTPNDKYHIFAHHTRFSNSGVRSVMYNDTAFVTVLRDPADVYESLFSYYGFRKVFNVSLEEILISPRKANKIDRRYFSRLGFNQMCWDLGMDENYFKSQSYVDDFIEQVDETFDLVMIAEWMEASLVLLCDLMSWPLENVMFLTLNSRPDSSKHRLTESERETLRQINSADARLYDYFLQKFRNRIREYGEERMVNDIVRLLAMNDKLNFRCVDGLNSKGFAHTTAYQLKNSASGDWTCVYATKSELAFTGELRNYQRTKQTIYLKLRTLLDDSDEKTQVSSQNGK